MKTALAIFLLVITLTATFFPCCQFDQCTEEEIAAAHDEKEEEPKGNCAPLFGCPSCPSFAELGKPVQLLQPQLEPQSYSFAILHFTLSTFPSSLWQPPRLC